MNALEADLIARIPARPAILIVEDEMILAKDLQRTLIDFGYDAFAIASSAASAVKRAGERCPDLVIMDIRIKGPLDGIEAARILKKEFSTAIIYLTAHTDRATLDRVKKAEPHGYLRKPVDVLDLRTTVEIALYRHQLEQARDAKAETARLLQVAFLEMGRAVHESNQSFRAMIESVKDYAIFMLDIDGRVASWNVGAERLHGYSELEVVGEHCSKFYPADEVDHGKPARDLEAAIRLGRMEDKSWRVRRDGTKFLAEVVITPVYDSHRKLRGLAKVTRDVTAPQEYEESLRVAKREADRANGAKSLFLANMSHEIRTPMNAVIGLTYLLEQTSLDSEQTELVAQINVASKALLAVITDVLDISKIEAGELLISRVAFSPRELLKGLHAIMLVQADRKGITLQLDLPDDLPAALHGDAVRLNQILTNLLSNAIKFTERGSVTLSVHLLGSRPTSSTMAFMVRDTGIGIDVSAQARLFTPFIQADESITRSYGGTGLGLSIINSLSKLMGGKVEFTSTVGVGSEFRVVLEFPLADAVSLAKAQSTPALRGARPLRGVRVLVADDYDLNLVVTQRILEEAGALVSVANNGQGAYEKLRLQPSHFDIVLMDVQMPIMDGYEATRRIRADLGLPDLPIIALTAGALSSERQRATAVGMDDFIIKPFDAATLIESVLRHTVGARGHPAQRSGQFEPPKEADTWPEIEGIDTQDARSRWCDDLALFRSMLHIYLDDFADIAAPSSRSSAQLGSQALRLHKLRGGACMLGAKTVQHLAAKAEAACMAGDAPGARERSMELLTHLDAMRSSAARAFENPRSGEGAMAVPSDIELEPKVVALRERIEEASMTPRRADSEGHCRVLLVEDDDIVRAHVANLLERSGYRVGQAASGEEAVRALRGGDYQIVVTDWMLPGMSGLELCRELRTGIENRDLYVILLTASDRPEDAELGRAAGADEYILKSAPNTAIIARIAAAQHITQQRSSPRETEAFKRVQ
jgi:PAS domain S-box-containing protein